MDEKMFGKLIDLNSILDFGNMWYILEEGDCMIIIWGIVIVLDWLCINKKLFVISLCGSSF